VRKVQRHCSQETAHIHCQHLQIIPTHTPLAHIERRIQRINEMENVNMQSHKLIPLTLLIDILIAKPMTAASTAPTPDSFNNRIK